MSTRLLYGIMQGYKKSQENYRNIQTARQKKKQDDEMFDLKKKQLQLDLEAKTRTGQIEKIAADQIMNQFKVDEKVYKAESDKKDFILDQASDKERKRGEAIKRTGQQVLGSIMKQKQEYEVGFDYGKGISIKPKKEEKRIVAPFEKSLGALKSGGQYNSFMGSVDKFKNRDAAETYARNSLGINWQRDFPEAVGIIDEKYGIALPESIKTTTDAVNYLTTEKNMTREKAIQYLRTEHQKRQEK